MRLDLYSVENFRKNNVLKFNDIEFHKVTPWYFTDFWVLDNLKRRTFNFSCVLNLVLRFKSCFTSSKKFNAPDYATATLKKHKKHSNKFLYLIVLRRSFSSPYQLKCLPNAKTLQQQEVALSGLCKAKVKLRHICSIKRCVFFIRIFGRYSVELYQTWTINIPRILNSVPEKRTPDPVSWIAERTFYC